MHLKSIGAIAARTLSYSACEFDMVDNVGSKKVRKVYDQSAELWTDLHTQLADRCAQLKEDEQRRETAAAQALLANKRRAELTALLPAARKPDEMEADGNEGALPDNLSSDAVDRLKAIISAFDTLQQLGSGVEN